MNPVLRISSALVAAAAACSLNLRANLVFQPPWLDNPSDPQWAGGVTTAQGWEWASSGFSPTPTVSVNLFGTALITPQNASPSTAPDWNGVTISTLHVDADGGGISILVPNSPIENFRKVVWVQITSDKGPSAAPAVEAVGGTPVSATGTGVAGLGGTWYTYAFSADLRPNPQAELIYFTFPESTDIEEVWVHTICVPEPAAWVLATGVALLGFAGWHRRHTRTEAPLANS